MKIYRNISITRAITLMIVCLLNLGVLTGCESIQFLFEQNEKYEEEAKIEAGEVPLDLNKELNTEEVEFLEEESDEVNLTDELIAADGLIINRELNYEGYLGRDGQSIIEELFVVRRDDEHRYGDVLNYNGNKFFCNIEDICYAAFVKKDKVLGIKFPAARTELVELMGAPVIANNEFQYYHYLDHIIRVPAANYEVKHCVVAKDINGLVAYMSSFNEETSYTLDNMLLDTKFEIMSQLGPAERETMTDAEVMHYDYQGIYFMLKGENNNKQVVRVLLTNYGGFGIDIGSTKDVLDEFYMKPIIKGDYYLYQYEDTFYSVHFRDGIVVGLQVMTEEETQTIDHESNPMSWADVSISE